MQNVYVSFAEQNAEQLDYRNFSFVKYKRSSI